MGRPLHAVPQGKTVRADWKDFHLPILKVGHVKPVLPRQSEGHVGGELALGRNTVDDFTVGSQDSDISLAEDGDVEQAIRIEGHAVWSLPTWGRIGANHVAKERARSTQFAVPPSIAEYIAANRFVQIEHVIRTESYSVGEQNSLIDLCNGSGICFDAI